MTAFDLAFLVAFLAAIITLVLTAIAAIRGQSARVRRLLGRLGLGLGLYAGVMVAVSLVSPGRAVPAGQEQCFDDWCISITNAVRTRTTTGDQIDVAFRLASHAGRVSQREQYVVPYLLDEAGARHAAQPAPGEIQFDVLLGPLESKSTTRIFRIPTGTRLAGVEIGREGAGWFPRCCIIGDQGSLLHRPTVLTLP